MKASKQTAQFVLEFSDIEDLTDDSEESQQSIHPQQPTPPPLPPPPSAQEQVQSILQIKREGVEMPQIAIENEEEAPQKRKIDIQDQYWQINFEDLDEQEDQGQEELPSPEPILINKEPSPPPVHIEEPQYIEQYFEDQNIIEEIEQVDIQKQEIREKNKQELFSKQQQKPPEETPQVNLNRVISRQKFYNPKNSLLYLRLRGREDLYKKLELIQEDPASKVQEKDDLLEGLDCINNLLLDLSSIKQPPLEKKPIPLQIQKHRLNEKGEHHKERKHQKKIDPAELEIIEKEKQEKVKAKLTESAKKQQQHQEAAQARQIRHEQLQQQKQLLKLLNQRQVYRITTKKLVSSGMFLYRCCLKEKQRDFVQWLRFSEIALINKGEDEILIFEKRLSDSFFMNANKKTITSVRITKNTIFDKVVIPYKEEEIKEVQQNKKKGGKNWTEKEEIKETRNRSREKHKIRDTEDEKSQERDNKKRKEKKQKIKEDEDYEIPKKEKHSQRKKEQNNSTEKSQEQIDTVITKENAQLDQKNGKVRCLESDDEEDNDLLDADKIKIFKVNNESKKKIEKKEVIQKEVIQKEVIQQPEESKNQQQEIVQITQNTKKSKFHRFRQQGIVLSRLETNDKIKKLQKIKDKRKEKRQKQYEQQLLEQKAKIKELKLQKQAKDDRKSKKAKDPQKEKNVTNNSSLERKTKSEGQNQQKTDSTKSTQNGKAQKNKQKKNLVKMTTRSTRIHNTRSGGTSSVSRSLQRASEVEPGYISTKRVYENSVLKKRKRRIIEDEDFEASPEMKKAQTSKQLRKK